MKRTLWKHSSYWAAGFAAVAMAAGSLMMNASATSESDRDLRPVPKAELKRAVDHAEGLSTAFRGVAQTVLPAVVTIETTPAVDWRANTPSEQPRDPSAPGRNPFKGTPFEDMFKDMPFERGLPHGQPEQPRRGGGQGSGFVYDEQGLILTNNHVVAGGGEVLVRLADGREFSAEQVWTDPKTDVAVVKIQPPADLIVAPIGNSDEMEIGDWVLALGQPFGLESTMTAGIISAKHRGIGITDRENFLQTDAAINPGNSGGPLVNLKGEVIGINTAISSRGGGNEGIGFAIPIKMAKWVADQLANGGTVHRAYLGVGIQPVTADLARQFQVKPKHGVLVTEVFPNTPAAKAGIQSGDVIVDFAGGEVHSPQELQIAVEQAPLGEPQDLRVVRDGKEVKLTFVPETQPNQFGSSDTSPAPASQPEDSGLANLGLEIGVLSADVAERLGLAGLEGVVVTDVRNGSPAANAGLEAGMVITHVNRQEVRQPQDVRAALEQGEDQDGVLLLVKTSNGSRFVVVRP